MSNFKHHDDDTCPHLVVLGRLETENARLKAEVERLTAFTTRTIIPNEELQAQVERLTKAGDSLVLSVEWRNVVIHDPTLTFIAVKPDCLCNCHNFDSDIKLWNAAKEGKQP